MTQKEKTNKFDWKKILGIFLFITLSLSIVFIIVQICLAPETVIDAGSHQKVKSDYTLMLIQCMLGLVVMFVPAILDKKLSISIPNYMYIMYFVFLYCAIYLGEVKNFYFVIPFWDDILHAFSGAMLGALGFTLVSILNEAKNVKINLSHFFVALFAFSFALAMGAIWEIYEFTFDGLLSLNMQKFILEDGTQLIGREALSDTMFDLIIDGASALVVTIGGYIILCKQDKSKNKLKPIK